MDLRLESSSVGTNRLNLVDSVHKFGTKYPDRHEADSAFCDGTNFEECMLYLAEEMTSIGIPRLLSLRQQQGDVRCLLNAAFVLLQRVQRAAEARQELENRLHSCERELELSRAQVMRQKEKSKSLLLEVAQLQETRRQQVVQMELLQSKVKSESDEVKRLGSLMSARDIQYQHELKKRERELALLKERMSRSLVYVATPTNMQKGIDKDRSPAITIINLLPDNHSNRKMKGSCGTLASVEEMYKTTISNYERERRLVVCENSELRRCLSDVHQEVMDLMAACSTSKGNINHSEADRDICNRDQLSCHDGHFQLPYDMICESVQQSFRSKCQVLRNRLNQGTVSPDDMPGVCFKPNALHKEEACFGQILSTQNSNPVVCRDETAVQASGTLFEKEQLQIQNMLAHLNNQRQVFEEEKAAWLKKQFFGASTSPNSPRTSSGSVTLSVKAHSPSAGPKKMPYQQPSEKTS